MFGISIIIPISCRSECLKELLESYINIDKPECLYELNVIDNSNNSDESAKIKNLCSEYCVNYFFISGGVVIARNYGYEIAKYTYLLFIDSDCILDKNILKSYESIINENRVESACGITKFYGQNTYLWSLIEKLPYLIPFEWSSWKQKTLWSPCSNFLISKKLFKNINGFRSVLPPREAGEDVDIGVRIKNANHIIICNPKSIVFHTKETWCEIMPLIEKIFRYGRGEVYLINFHKELSYLSMPSNILVFFILLSICILIFMLTDHINNINILSIPFVWSILCIIVTSTFTLFNQKNVFNIMALSFFDSVYNAGFMFEALKKCMFNTVFRKFKFSEEYYMGAWHQSLLDVYTFVISFVMLIYYIIWLK